MENEQGKPIQEEVPSFENQKRWKPRLSKNDKEQIAKAIFPRFCSFARELGFDQKEGWVDKEEPVYDTFYFKGEPPYDNNFVLLVKLNPFLDIRVFKSHLIKAGLPDWFIESIVRQYTGHKYGIARGLDRITGNWREWIHNLRDLPGTDVWRYLTASMHLKKRWERRLKKSTMSIGNLQISQDAAVDITALLWHKTGIADHYQALSSLRKLVSRPLKK